MITRFPQEKAQMSALVFPDFETHTHFLSTWHVGVEESRARCQLHEHIEHGSGF